MGIRETQFVGLNDRARLLIEGRQVVGYYEKRRYTYPEVDTKKVDVKLWESAWVPVMKSDVTKALSGKAVTGMFGEKIPLYTYKFPDGEIFEEVVQAEPWSSGPVIFLCLVGSNPEVEGELKLVTESEWTEAEMQEYL